MSASTREEDEFTTQFLEQTRRNSVPMFNKSPSRQLLEEIGIPRLRDEMWKYTNPRTIVTALQESLAEGAIPRALEGSVEIYSIESESQEINNRYSEELLDDKSKYPLVAVNALAFNSGYVIQTTGNHVVHAQVLIDSAPKACERFVIAVDSGSSLEVIEQCSGGNRVFECLIDPNATFTHRRIQKPSNEIEFAHIRTRVAENANYNFIQYSSGATLRRNEVVVDMVGPSATANLSGGWRTHGKSHLDSHVAVNHIHSGASSRQKFRGTVHDRSRVAFNGRIYIAPNAQQTDAQLSNKNILGSPEAEVYTKPELEIYANDVVCSHGATTGQLDEEQLFYLRSRGIPDDFAKRLLIKGFLQEIVEHDLGAEVLDIKDAA